MKLDHEADWQRKQERKAFEKLLNHLKESDEEWSNNAIAYIRNLEEKIEKLKNDKKKYENFFETLNEFLPRPFSPFDTIG